MFIEVLISGVCIKLLEQFLFAVYNCELVNPREKYVFILIFIIFAIFLFFIFLLLP